MSRETGPVLTDPELPGRIAGYRLDRYIGRGSLAVVYLARDERLDQQVALKVLEPELARDAAFRARFLRDSQAAAAIGHPHIIPVYEAGDADGLLYLAMRYVRGGDARSLLNRLGPLPCGQAWGIVAQVASALDAAHARGLVHRDVKPANMLLDTSAAGHGSADQAVGSDSGHVFLSDFGMTRNSRPGEAAAAGQYPGTLDYLAPEQIEGRAVDGRADLYSLACAGFELLCGTPPFGQDQGLTVLYAQLYAPPPAASSRRPELPAAVDRVLATALAKDPADRYATCGQFAEQLQAALGLRPGERQSPAPLVSPGRAGQVAAATLTSGQDHPAAQAEPQQPAQPPSPQTPWPQPPAPQPPSPQPPSPQAPGSAMTLAGQPEAGPAPAAEPGQSAEPAPAAEPARAAAELASTTGGSLPERRQRHGGKGLILTVAAVVIAAALAVGIALAGRSGPSTPAASSRTRSAAPSPTSPAASPTPSPTPSASTPAPTPTPTPAPGLAARQAAAVNSLLGSSEAARTALQAPVVEVGNCANLPGAAAQIQAVVNQRSAQLSQASALSTAALPGGAALRTELIGALRSSLDADEDYLTWAQQQSSGCTPAAESSAYSAAVDAGQQADAAKAVFAEAWNPVAARYGIAQISSGSF